MKSFILVAAMVALFLSGCAHSRSTVVMGFEGRVEEKKHRTVVDAAVGHIEYRLEYASPPALASTE